MNSRQMAHRCLYDWNQKSGFAEDIFSRRQAEWNITGSERGFARELFYGVLRNLSALDFLIETLTSRPPALEPRLALQMGLYQLLFLQTASHAAVSETVDLVSRPQRGFINGVLRRVAREIPKTLGHLAAQPDETRLSHPRFFLDRWAAQYGPVAARQIAEWNNTPPDVYLRRNTLQPVTTKTGLEPTSHPLIFRSQGELSIQMASGEFYAQDPSTLLAVELLNPQPGEQVLDACAAPGGKTSYLAALMKNEGKITATDADARRLERLEQNLTRLGVSNTIIQHYDWELANAGEMPADFDAVLADVPCSNTGVMRRRIDVRWRLQPSAFAECATRQIQLLGNLSSRLKVGGRIVYSTCSLEKTENEDVVSAFLQQHPMFKLETAERRLPQVDASDGSFAALVRRCS